MPARLGLEGADGGAPQESPRKSRAATGAGTAKTTVSATTLARSRPRVYAVRRYGFGGDARALRPQRIAGVTAAVGWGALAASSLVIGALLGLVRPWPRRLVGLVLAFGAGALISAVSFDLAQGGAQVGDPGFVALGLSLGAITYFTLDRMLGRQSPRGNGAQACENAGPALALGAFLDGIPEQTVLGIGIAAGEGVSVGLLVAIFVSNLPEAIGSSTEMRAAGTPREAIRRLWLLVALICVAASVVGYTIADNVSGNLNAAVDGFAAGALLVMLIDSMVPEAVRKGGDISGLVTVLGFAVAAALSGVS
jgi:ZIP family zinc transporter